jgi:50S ribosomal subunit-associated GTPase HflX
VFTAIDEAHADPAIADGGISLRQGRLLEGTIGVRDVDRTALILGVLAEDARSSDRRLPACTQIAYQLPPTTPGHGLSGSATASSGRSG